MSTFQSQRREMVERDLLSRGIQDVRVLEAMRTVRRELFVPLPEQDAAYEDRALPLSSGQTISQPFTVAFMCESLQLRGFERVLEIGTGSGYAAAVLSLLAAEVHTVERIPELANSARVRLRELGFANVTVHLGDGTAGLPDWGPFDGIVVTAGGRELPRPLSHQLTEGGRLVIPLQGDHGGQMMHRITRRGSELMDEHLGQFAFVPLIGAYGWPED